MKKLIVLLAVAAMFPQVAGSADFSRHVSADAVIENRGGQVLLVPRSNLSKRIEVFAVKNGADPAIAPELAELLVACEHPRVLAAIAAKESRFNLRARGRAGEVGAYQITPRHHGNPGRTWSSQTKSADRILNELVSESDGKLSDAVRRYNGSGSAARNYSRGVLALVASI